MTIRELWLRAIYPFRRGRVARELRDEMDLHLAMRAERLRDAGMSAEDARLEARRRFGNVSRLVNASRAAWGWPSLDGFGQDLRYVGRQLRRSPLFAFVTVCTIALGIGINTTAFTFYDAIVLKPLPVSDPASMVRVVTDLPIPTPEFLPWSAYEVLGRDAHSVRSVVAITGQQSLSAVLPGRAPDDARSTSARFVSPDFFAMLGIHPRIGRWFAGSEDAVVLDYSFWTNQLAADPSVVGRSIDVGGRRLTIVGVAPEGFAGTGLPAIAPELWIPLSLQPTLLPGADWRYDGRAHWQVLARTPAGTTLAGVAAEAKALQRAIVDTAGKPLPLVAKRATFFQSDAGEFDVFQQVSAALMVALGLILAIAVVNLVNLLAARNAAREREVVVRLALGASRARIGRQLATESIVLALAGGLLGLVVSARAALWLRQWIVNTLASVTGGFAGVFLDIGLDWRVATYAMVLAGVIGLCVGVWPALRAARTDATTALRQGANSTAGASALGRRNLLLAMQVGGSIILLTAAGMLLGGLRFAREIDPGFDASHMIVVDVYDGLAPAAQRMAMRAEIGRRLSALPEARAVAWSRRVPFGGTHLRRGQSSAGAVTLSIDNVSDTYIDAMGMPILRGRNFTAAESEVSAPLMLVSASLARLRWPGRDPIGQSVPPNDLLTGPDSTRAYTVVGVVPDVRTNFLSRVNAPSAYYAFGYHGDFGSFLVRTRGAPASAMKSVRLVIADLRLPATVKTRISTMTDGPMAVQRLFAQAPAVVALALALVGLLLASVGVYGLISQIVTRRTREIGVHVALGARRPQVIGLVMRKTMRPVAWGAVVGGVGALGVSALLRSLIATPDAPDLTFGAGAFNPIVFLGVLVVLGCVVVVACYGPAWRAATVDPTVALRAE